MTLLNPNDNPPSLDQIATQLASPSSRDRVLAMIELQKDTVSAEAASPLIQKALRDEAVQVRGMATFYLGIKPTPRSLNQLVQILTDDPDYNVRSMAAGALGYLEDKQALEALRHAFYEDTSWLVQFSAAIALGNLQVPQAKAVLLDALESETVLLQEAAI
ncbi:MAG: HEAT repeat domain-containing protein, partial [Cyanobacteria bacterium J06659_2]